MMLIILGVIGLISICILIVFILIYNRFQRLKNGAEAGLSQIKVALKKRLDMISQLVDVVKSYIKFEKNVFENIAYLRSMVGQIKDTNDVSNINNDSKNVLEKIIALVENYPNLKASKNVEDLMNAIRDVEEEISRQRYTYNNIVQEYNTRLESIPSNVIGKICSYKKLDYLKFEKEVDYAPKAELK
jgi:LemA protein